MKFPVKRKQKKDRKVEFDDSTLLSLDVGTSTVKACAFKIEAGKVVVLGYGKALQQSDAMKGAMIINLQNVIENCDLAIGEAVREIQNQLPRKMIIGIAGELVRGVPIVAKYEREKPDEKIGPEEIDSVFEKVRKSAFNDVKSEIADETGLLDEQIEELGSVINDTYIDGFRVINPLNYKGKSVNFRVFSTFAPSIHVNSLKTIPQSLGFEVLDIIVEPYALTRAFEGGLSDNFDAIYIDVGGGTTDIAIVQKGGIIGTKMMAFGGRVFTKRIETYKGLDYRKAEKYKISYSERELPQSETTEIQKLFEQDAKLWVKGVEIALKEFDDVEIFPSKILLCGGGALLPEIKKALSEHPWLQLLRFRKFPEVEFIHPQDLKNIIDENKYLKDVSDVAPAALAIMALEKKETK